jgi:hypothetical protein
MTSQPQGGGSRGIKDSVTICSPEALILKNVTIGGGGVKYCVTSFMSDPSNVTTYQIQVSSDEFRIRHKIIRTI